MIDTSSKFETLREARAEARVKMAESTLEAVKKETVHKGNVLEIARAAVVMAWKRTVGLISHYFKGGLDFSDLFFLGFAVFVGAQLGSFLGTKKFSPLFLQRIFAVILVIVSLKLGIGILG